MRRLAAIGVCVLAAAVALLSTGAGTSGSGEKIRVDALFDNSGGLIPGQDVKIAGAEVGQVESIHLTKDRKARVEMKVAEEFAPFRSDADCTIRPQSLIGEKFVQCEPGTADAPPIRKGKDPAPTVRSTHSPVDLDLIFAALRLPVRERLRLVVNELGTGLAGRPEELNAAIRRANPALGQTNRVLAILDQDRAELGRLIDRSDRVVAELARRRGDVAGFIDDAESVAGTVADRRGDLDLAVRRLPALLAELEPSANELAGLSREGRPVVRAVRRAADPARALLADFDPLADATRPTLRKLSSLSRTGRSAVRAAGPVAVHLRPVAKRLPPIVNMATELVENLRDRGGVENLLQFLFQGVRATARFDSTSHVAPSYQVSGTSTCNLYAQTPVPGCSGHFPGATDIPGASTARRKSRDRDSDSERALRRLLADPHDGRRRGREPDRSGGGGGGPSGGSAGGGSSQSGGPVLPGLPSGSGRDPYGGLPLLDYLLGP